MTSIASKYLNRFSFPLHFDDNYIYILTCRIWLCKLKLRSLATAFNKGVEETKKCLLSKWHVLCPHSIHIPNWRSY